MGNGRGHRRHRGRGASGRRHLGVRATTASLRGLARRAGTEHRKRGGAAGDPRRRGAPLPPRRDGSGRDQAARATRHAGAAGNRHAGAAARFRGSDRAPRPGNGRRSAHQLRRRRARAHAPGADRLERAFVAGSGRRAGRIREPAHRDVGGRQRARRPAICRSRRLLLRPRAQALSNLTSRSRLACCVRRSTARRTRLRTRISSSDGPSCWRAAWGRGCVSRAGTT